MTTKISGDTRQIDLCDIHGPAIATLQRALDQRIAKQYAAIHGMEQQKKLGLSGSPTHKKYEKSGTALFQTTEEIARELLEKINNFRDQGGNFASLARFIYPNNIKEQVGFLSSLS